MVVDVKTGDDNAGVVYRVKSTGSSTEHCVTPYEGVTLSDRVSFIFTDCCLF